MFVAQLPFLYFAEGIFSLSTLYELPSKGQKLPALAYIYYS